MVHCSFPDALWAAPEHIFNDLFPRSQLGDVFSYGIVLSEILTRALPYNMFEDLSYKGLFLYLCCLTNTRVAENHCAALASVVVITLACLAENPSSFTHFTSKHGKVRTTLYFKFWCRSRVNSAKDIKIIGRIVSLRVDLHLNAGCS